MHSTERNVLQLILELQINLSQLAVWEAVYKIQIAAITEFFLHNFIFVLA